MREAQAIHSSLLIPNSLLIERDLDTTEQLRGINFFAGEIEAVRAGMRTQRISGRTEHVLFFFRRKRRDPAG